jgi:hypothetical protein
MLTQGGTVDDKLLTSYLNDHLTGASAGVELFRRAARNHRDDEMGGQLADLAREVEDDRTQLTGIMDTLQVRRNPASVLIGVAAERLGRFKPNGYVVRRSPLSDVVELEGMRVGVAGKLGCWETLLALAVEDSRLDRTALEALVRRANDQYDRIRTLHLRVAADRLT